MAKTCNPPLLWLTRILFELVPSTRFFPLKRKLLSISGVDIHPSARVCSSVRIATSGHLAIGADTFIGHEVLISGGDSSITIGSYCDIAPRVSILSGGHEIAASGPRAAGPGCSKTIVIEDGVWIGAEWLILGVGRVGQCEEVLVGR